MLLVIKVSICLSLFFGVVYVPIRPLQVLLNDWQKTNLALKTNAISVDIARLSMHRAYVRYLLYVKSPMVAAAGCMLVFAFGASLFLTIEEWHKS